MDFQKFEKKLDELIKFNKSVNSINDMKYWTFDYLDFDSMQGEIHFSDGEIFVFKNHSEMIDCLNISKKLGIFNR